MRLVTYNWRERLDTGLGSLFVFYFLGAVGFLLFGRHLLANYLIVGAASFVFFMLACPWIPGKQGITKVLLLEVLLGGALIATAGSTLGGGSALRADLIIAMVMLLFYGSELGGLASTLPSDLDPFLARLGIGAVGNVAMAGTVRTELLNGYRELTYDRGACNGCRWCHEVCPQGVWDAEGSGELHERGEARRVRTPRVVHGLPGLPDAMRAPGHPSPKGGSPRRGGRIPVSPLRDPSYPPARRGRP